MEQTPLLALRQLNVIYKMKFPLFATERHTVIRTQLTIATYNKLHKIQVNRVAEPPRRLTGCSTPLAAVHSFLFRCNETYNLQNFKFIVNSFVSPQNNSICQATNIFQFVFLLRQPKLIFFRILSYYEIKIIVKFILTLV